MNIEQGILNDEVKIQILYFRIQNSLFNIHYSFFLIYSTFKHCPKSERCAAGSSKYCHDGHKNLIS